jgi:hypothetical protein
MSASVSLQDSFNAEAWGVPDLQEEQQQIGTKAFLNTIGAPSTMKGNWNNPAAVVVEVASTIQALMYAIARVRADFGPSDTRDRQLVEIKNKAAKASAEYFMNLGPLGGLKKPTLEFIHDLAELSKFLIKIQGSLEGNNLQRVLQRYGSQDEFEKLLSGYFPYKKSAKEVVAKKLAGWLGHEIVQKKTYIPELAQVASVILEVGDKQEAKDKQDMVYMYFNLVLAFFFLLEGDAQKAEDYFGRAKVAGVAGIENQKLKFAEFDRTKALEPVVEPADDKAYAEIQLGPPAQLPPPPAQFPPPAPVPRPSQLPPAPKTNAYPPLQPPGAVRSQKRTF